MRDNLYDPDPELRIWQGTWPAGEMADAQKAMLALREKYPHLGAKLEWMEPQQAEFLKDKFMDWASDHDFS